MQLLDILAFLGWVEDVRCCAPSNQHENKLFDKQSLPCALNVTIEQSNYLEQLKSGYSLKIIKKIEEIARPKHLTTNTKKN